MPSSAAIRQKIADLAKKRADLETRIGTAQRVKSRKDAESASKIASANKTSSASSQRMYLRQAESAQKAALAEGKKIADLSQKLASVAKEEGQRNKELATAIKSETAAQARADAKARTEREAAEKKRRAEARAAELSRQRERLADEQRRRDDELQRELDRMSDRASAAALVAATEERLNQQIEAIRPPKREQLRILYATATSQGDLRVDEEIRRVKAAVRASTHRDQVLIDHLPAATPSDLLDGLTRLRPHVVHFSGHANETVLVFDSGDTAAGPGTRVTAEAFKNAVEAPDEPPILVVLNACKSAAQLNSLLGKVVIAVGMSDSVGDPDAITFATRFYRTLAEGQSVNAAMATARADMEMNGLPDHDLPTMAMLPGIDPTTVRLVIGD
jgi:hypothetical protein